MPVNPDLIGCKNGVYTDQFALYDDQPLENHLF